LPFTKNGTIGHQAEKIKGFVEGLRGHLNIEIEYRDESLTTFEARQLMQETRKKKKRKTEKDDAIAAAFLLQHYLEEQREKCFPSEIGENLFNEDR